MTPPNNIVTDASKLGRSIVVESGTPGPVALVLRKLEKTIRQDWQYKYRCKRNIPCAL